MGSLFRNGYARVRPHERRQLDAYTERVASDPKNRNLRSSGEPWLASLRAYREHHPSLRVFVVERNGRTVWLTFKQLQILHYIDRSEHRNRRLRLVDIAKAVGVHVSTVSRTLVRFDLWRFIDYVTLVGRHGGAWILTRIARHQEADANLAAARQTIQSRKVARSWLATQFRLRTWRYRREWKQRPKPPHIWRVTTGSMDAMFP